MGKWVEACGTDELPSAGEGKTCLVDERKVAVFRLESGELIAIDDECPHAYGSLGEGMLIDDVVVCPLHGWSFSIHTGELEGNASIRLRTYDVREDDGTARILLGESETDRQ